MAPTANNRLSTLYFRSTFANRVAGVNPFIKDLNCHCIDPNKDLVLNPAAWQDPADGQFGTAAAYYNDYRYQRRPSENINFGRVFRIREKMSLTMRMEFSNVFNRTEMANPSVSNALATTTTNTTTGVLTGGFGYINPGSVFTTPRQGTGVVRFSF